MSRRFAFGGAATLVAALAATLSAAPDRASIISRARVWAPTDIPALDMRRGPRGAGSFEPGQTVTCDFVDKEFDGNSQKFACRIAPQDEVKVKFGSGNGEVQGEVAATRLLWALGFAADRMYPVRVICRGCPADVGRNVSSGAGPGAILVEPAVIERKLPGHGIPGDDGWSWPELDGIDERAGGATLAQRDALKLLAVLLQHTDTKPEQQRLVCVGDDDKSEACAHPLMMLNDVGLTFGRATLGNLNATSSVNLEEWKRAPIWKGPTGCVGNLPKSLTGTLKDPVISDAGRVFLARLLTQLSDAQLRDLFTVAGVGSLGTTVDEWVQAFKQKRLEIVERRCVDSWSSVAPPGFGTGPIVWLQSRATPGVTRAMNIVSLAGYTGVYLALAVALGLGYRWRAGAALLLLLALSPLIANAVKSVVSFPRPDAVDQAVHALSMMTMADAPDYGFPSGHVASATVFFFGLVFLFGWRWAWIGLALWVPAMSISRIYLGRHFPADVLGGFGVGVIVTAIGVQAMNLRRLSARDVDPARAWRMARRVFVIAAALTVSNLVLRVPSAYDAGRLLGLAASVLLLVKYSDAADASSLRVRIARVALTAVLFPLAWWALRDAHPLVAGAIPAALLLAGTVLIPAGVIHPSSVRNTASRAQAPRRSRTIARTPPS